MSIADRIYESLKSSIISAELKGGDRLFEAKMAESCHASRTPVREAFRRLEQDCLVERVAQGGVRVTQVNRKTVEDLFGIRTVLEEYAIGLACDRITPDEIAALKEIRAQAWELLNSKQVSREYMLRRFFDLNSLFHETIYAATDSKFLIKLISDIRGIVLGLRSVSIQADQACSRAWEEHSLLIDHLEKREKDKAVSLIKEHIANAVRDVLSARQNPGSVDPRSAAGTNHIPSRQGDLKKETDENRPSERQGGISATGGS
jgi:DNA-binding GntR family transcriptional regulator